MSYTDGGQLPLNQSDLRADDHDVAAIVALQKTLRTSAFVPSARFAGKVDRTAPVAAAAKGPSLVRTIATRSAIAVVTAAMSTLYFWLAYHIVFTMRIGPVIGVVNAASDMGIHSGDILAIPLALLGIVTALAGIVTVFGKSLPIGGSRQAPRLRSYRPAPVGLASFS